MKKLALCLMLTGCVHGKDVVSPTEPDYQVLCVDSTLVDTTRVCWQDNVIEIIYGNKVAYIDLNSESAFIIENEKIAAFQRKLFLLLYDRLGDTV